MKKVTSFFVFMICCSSIVFTSCSTIEKASQHGFNSGYYKMDVGEKPENVYVDVSEEKIDVYNIENNTVENKLYQSIPLIINDSTQISPIKFSKQSPDLDITTIFFKYRPSVYNLPAQLTTDLNVALYAGWRYDNYYIRSKTDPLNRKVLKINNFGYDFGVFAGPGTTLICPFTTNNQTSNEYNGMIFQSGVAGFIESDIASFGVAIGFDYLLNNDRNIWIYNNKPWVGFIVGIAFN